MRKVSYRGAQWNLVSSHYDETQGHWVLLLAGDSAFTEIRASEAGLDPVIPRQMATVESLVALGWVMKGLDAWLHLTDDRVLVFDTAVGENNLYIEDRDDFSRVWLVTTTDLVKIQRIVEALR